MCIIYVIRPVIPQLFICLSSTVYPNEIKNSRMKWLTLIHAKHVTIFLWCWFICIIIITTPIEIILYIFISF